MPSRVQQRSLKQAVNRERDEPRRRRRNCASRTADASALRRGLPREFVTQKILLFLSYIYERKRRTTLYPTLCSISRQMLYLYPLRACKNSARRINSWGDEMETLLHSGYKTFYNSLRMIIGAVTIEATARRSSLRGGRKSGLGAASLSPLYFLSVSYCLRCSFC